MSSIIFDHISAFSVIVPLSLVFFQLTKLSKTFKFILYLLISSVLADCISLILISNGINSWPVVNLYFIVQFIFLYLVFTQSIKSKVLQLFFYTFIIFCLVNYSVIQSPLKFNSISSYSGALFMLVLALSYLYRLFWNLPVERVQDLPMLWIAFAVLIYFGGTLFLFLFNNYLIDNEPGTHQAIWVLHNMLNVSKNVFLSIALWKHYKQSTSPG